MAGDSDRDTRKPCQDARGRIPAGYLSVSLAADYLCVSARFLRSHLGEIPHFRWGHRVLIRRDELDEWMERHRVEASSLSKDELDEMVQWAVETVST